MVHTLLFATRERQIRQLSGSCSHRSVVADSVDVFGSLLTNGVEVNDDELGTRRVELGVELGSRCDLLDHPGCEGGDGDGGRSCDWMKTVGAEEEGGNVAVSCSRVS